MNESTSMYLYGASVQGIQEFIFKTNMLKEIVGASQLVDSICTTEFESFCNKIGHQLNQSNFIIKAAGNIKYILDEETCKKIVYNFPKHISNYAPGITISQATVKLSAEYITKQDIDDLELKLKTQRNKPNMPIEFGFMGLERARRTGGVAFDIETKADQATLKKTEGQVQNNLKLFENFKGSAVNVNNLPFKIDDITHKSENSWIAIVHADGNSLGILLQDLSRKLAQNPEKIQGAFSRFSVELENATKAAAQLAFGNTIELENSNQKYPIRPVVLGGDDLTLIIRADLALNFTSEFLKAFESETKKAFSFLKTDYNLTGYERGITACAGIAYIKESYPFHYGVHLAESLTTEAKKYSKAINTKLPPSSLSFYKVQASYIESLKDMKERTLTAKASFKNFDYGPYLINDLPGKASVSQLSAKMEIMKDLEKDDNKSVSKLRQWITELHKDESSANFILDRMEQINPAIYAKLELGKERTNADNKTIIHDLILLESFN